MNLRTGTALLQTLACATLARAQTNPGNTSGPFVCTATECLRGQHPLAAGVVVETRPSNASAQQFTLLPGTYTSAGFASLSNDSSASPFSNGPPTIAASPGFTSSGSLDSASAYSVSFLPGIVTYTSPYYEGTATYLSTPNVSGFPANSSQAFSSVLLGSSTRAHAVLSIGSRQRVVVWESIPDVGALGLGGAASNGATMVDLVHDGCSAECSTAGTCSSNGTCVCQPGWTGTTCGECLPNFYGRDCQTCPVGCTTCDDGVSGTGICLDSIATNVTVPSSCNCLNGVCSGNSTSANCDCNAGWTRASNGTQCSACAEGYYLSASGDCLGTCQTCRTGLQPLSSSSTACTTATTALANGTFIQCPSRTFFSSSSNECVACNSMCESCFKDGVDGCLECRAPNVLLEGLCVAFDPKTGVCDGRSSKLTTSSNAGWVYDTAKKTCDALPAKCTKGGINSFSLGSTRNQLACSACIPGSFLVNGECIDSCPTGTTVSQDGTTCQACDSTCSNCLPSRPSYCTGCTTSSNLLLNGTCTSSCPTGYFSSNNISSLSTTTSTCLACHPDCATCSTDATTCLSCPPSRPVLVAGGKCVPTCAQNEYYDVTKRECVACSNECGTCYGSSKDECLSCRQGSNLQVRAGKCAATDQGCTIVKDFGVCLKDLVTVGARQRNSDPEDKVKRKLPWWIILIVVLVIVGSIVVGAWWFRKKEQKRRRAHTAKFAHELGNKEVDQKLAALPLSIAYPPLPRSSSSPTSIHRPVKFDQDGNTVEIPLTPRFVIEDPTSPVSPSPSIETTRRSQDSARVEQGGVGTVSNGERTFRTAAGNTLVVNSKNPFFR
ncbi:uncharacterized protein JCM15063_002235 [Sporobolomyces koalae]|uniref:uncharacterized protein n=1 Tax=Sporobolomyces koalae TaxID=500713 RepID=UPI003175CC7E